MNNQKLLEKFWTARWYLSQAETGLISHDRSYRRIRESIDGAMSNLMDLADSLPSQGFPELDPLPGAHDGIMPEEADGPELPPKKTLKKSLKIAFIRGHHSRAKGATLVAPYNQSEWDYWADVNGKSIEYASAAFTNVEVREFLRPPGGFRAGLEKAYGGAVEWSADILIETHFNAATPRATGAEVLLSTYKDQPGAKGEERLAKLMVEGFYDLYDFKGIQRRGLKSMHSGGNGYTNVNMVFDRPSILIEPFFGSNESDAKMGHEKRDELARLIVDVCVDYWES